MMGCLKKTNYDDHKCMPEIQMFLSCAAEAVCVHFHL